LSNTRRIHQETHCTDVHVSFDHENVMMSRLLQRAALKKALMIASCFLATSKISMSYKHFSF
jgi:hypothetical protein